MAKKFNGKPMKHWEEMAAEMVVEALLRASYKYYDPKSPLADLHLPGKLAGQKLMELAMSYRPDLVDKINKERDACANGFARIMSDIIGIREGSATVGAPIKRENAHRITGVPIKRGRR